jgi:glycosyltransferase involved in cell wall biosynthesis
MTVSIITAIHNGQTTLEQCLNSIHQQTFTAYELICINDCSHDNTEKILKKWQAKFLPDQLKIINNLRQLGLTKSLNIGLKASRSKYIARIDADDTWHPEKLAKQLAWLTVHPDYGILGTFYINLRQQSRQYFSLPKTDQEIKQKIFRLNPFGHSCVVIKRQLLEQTNGYDENIYYGQDRDLWFRCLPLTKFHNLDEFLCFRRADSGLSVSHSRQQMWQGIKTRLKYINKYRAPLINYLYLAEPLAIILIPRFIRQRVLSPRVLSRALRPVPAFLKEAFRNSLGPGILPAVPPVVSHSILCLNDYFLPNKYAHGVARLNMTQAFSQHPQINKAIFLYHSLPHTSRLFKQTNIQEKKMTGPYLTPSHPLAFFWNKSIFVFNTIRLVFTNIAPSYDLIYMRVGAAAGLATVIRNLFTQRVIIHEIHNYELGSHFFKDLIYKFIFRRCNKIVTISNYTKKNWVRHGVPARKILVLPSGVDPEIFNKTTANPHQLRQQLALPLNKKIILYFGHLYRHRGIEDILQAADSLKANKNLLFLFVGGNKKDVAFYKNYQQQHFPNLINTLFLGYVAQSLIPAYTKCADLLLITYSAKCPTVKSMSPLKLLEAMAANTPLIVADLPNIRLLIDDKTGNFYQPDNASSLAQQTNYVLDNYSPAQAKAQQAWQKVQSLNWQNRVAKIMKFL